MAPQELFLIFDTFFQSLGDAIAAIRKQQEKPKETGLSSPLRASKESINEISKKRHSVNEPSLRDRLMQEIRDKALTAITPSPAAKNSASEECNQCGLPWMQCDCTF
jgi:hypothetical protein